MTEFMNKHGFRYTKDRNAGPLDKLYSAMIDGNVNSVISIINNDVEHKIFTRGALGDICLALGSLANDTRLSEEGKSKIIKSVRELIQLDTKMDKQDGQVMLDEYEAKRNAALTEKKDNVVTEPKSKEQLSTQETSQPLEEGSPKERDFMPDTISRLSNDPLITRKTIEAISDGESLLVFKDALATQLNQKEGAIKSVPGTLSKRSDSGYGSEGDHEVLKRRESISSELSQSSSSSNIKSSVSTLSTRSSSTTSSVDSVEYGRHTKERAAKRQERAGSINQKRVEELVGIIKNSKEKEVRLFLSGKHTSPYSDKEIQAVHKSLDGDKSQTVKANLSTMNDTVQQRRNNAINPQRSR